ncbi:MAG: hypothetical protein ACXADX_14525, partial [Candidatus Hodarchaeales archaeon]
YLADSEVAGIKTLRFHLDPEEFKPNSKYHQYIHGMANMTPTIYNEVGLHPVILKIMLGTPLYVGFPHFQTWSQSQAQNTVPEEYDILVDIEPNTGLVLWGHKRLQYNMKLYNFSFFNTNVKGAYAFEAEDGTSHYIEPIMWVDRFGMIPNDKVAEAKDDISKITSGRDLADQLGIFGLGAGLGLFVAGVAMVIIPKFAGAAGEKTE